MKKTKIIATIGPACSEETMIVKLIEAGVNVFRLNFSHGSKKEKAELIHRIRSAEKRLQKPVAILQDLQGPKIRVGIIADDSVYLKPGSQVVLTVDKPKEAEIAVQYKGLPNDVFKGDAILLDDGLLELKVISKTRTKVKAKVIVGGVLYSNKGINLPDATLTIPALSEKDKSDLLFGLEHNVDYVALSFVKTAQDVEDLKKIIKKKGKETKVISKIERHEAITNIDEIIQVSDAIMVARGDLGVELSQEMVPLHQKDIIKKSIVYGRPVIVATQMLDSMIRNPRSTRAEASDIANAILDGADAVMLSGETAVGKYPVESVKVMRKIALGTEKWAIDRGIFIKRGIHRPIENVRDSIGKSAGEMVKDMNIRLIVNATLSGGTALAIAKYRPHANILSVTHSAKTARELELVWGVHAYKVDFKNIDEVAKRSLEIARKKKLVRSGEKVIIITGSKIGEKIKSNGSNIIKIIEA